MYSREDFIQIEIKEGDGTRPPYPEELDQIVKAAEIRLREEIRLINSMLCGGIINYEEDPK